MPTFNDGDTGNTVDGTADDDIINGNGGDDRLNGLGGDDILDGGADDDVLVGGVGIDSLYGGDGDDTLGNSTASEALFIAYIFLTVPQVAHSSYFVDGGSDNYYGGDGTDEALAYYVYETGDLTFTLAANGATSAILNGGSAFGEMSGIEQVRFLGGSGDDTLTGGDMTDTLGGLDGDDVLTGGGDDDFLLGGAGDDILDGGDGDNDNAFFTGNTTGVTVDLAITTAQDTGEGLDTFINIESLTGYSGNDLFYGNEQNNTLTGGSGGDDQLFGRGGDDTLAIAGTGDHIVDGGSGFDRLAINTPTGAVTIDLAIETAQDTLGAGILTITNIEHFLISDSDDHTIYGTAGSNHLFVSGGDDQLFGRDGDDILQGRGGNDLYDGGDGDNDAVAFFGAADITVDLTLVTAQDTGDGVDTFTDIESLWGDEGADTFTGSDVANVLAAGGGDDTLEGLGGNDTLFGEAGDDVLNGGDGDDVLDGDRLVTYDISLALITESGDPVAGADTLNGGDGGDRLIGGLGDDTLDGGSNVDTAVFSGDFADYTISSAGGTVTVSGADGTDTLTNIEFLEFDDQTFHWRPGTGQEIDFGSDPDTFMSQIRDFDGNDLGAPDSWDLIGSVDIQGDGDQEYLFFNRDNGRWASVGPAEDGLVYFDDHGWAGDTRVVGIYIDPLVESGDVVAGSDHDSQRRFQNDINIGNIAGILGADDYDGDGLQEVYFSLTDGTAYLHAYMHADGNIRYANYQNQQQVIDYLTDNGYSSDAWDGWFPEAAGLIVAQDDFVAA